MANSDWLRQARRDLGRRLAAARVRAGITQHQLAPLVYFTRSTIANAEVGRQPTSRTFWERCDAALHLDGALIAAYDDVQASELKSREVRGAAIASENVVPRFRQWPTGREELSTASVITPEAAHGPQQPVEDELVTAWVSADTVELVDQLTGRDLTLNRRRAGQALATIACGAPLLEALERWLVLNDLRPGAGASSGVGYQEIEQIEYAARLFREWDDQFGGGLRRKAVVGQLSEVAELLHERHPPAIRQRLFGVMAQLAETAAIMSWDSGYQGLAQHYYLLAFRSARTAGDHAFGAVVLAGMARQLLYLDKPQDALELARMAQDSALDHTTPAVRAMLHTREAWAFAKLGRLTAFRRATDQAEEALTGSQPAAEPHWIGYFDAAELDGTTGGRLLELAHQDTRYAAEAAGRIGRALNSRSAGHLRSGALDQIGLAEARVIEGECEEAARLGHAAVTLAKQTSSDRVRIKLAELYRYSTSKASAPAVAELRERIRSALVPQSA